MKRTKRLTKKEPKAVTGPRPAAPGHHHHHIHCTGCGRHLDIEDFDEAPGQAPEATWVRCDHGSEFASCTGCLEHTRELLREHDRTGQPVRAAELWH